MVASAGYWMVASSRARERTHLSRASGGGGGEERRDTSSPPLTRMCAFGHPFFSLGGSRLTSVLYVELRSWRSFFGLCYFWVMVWTWMFSI